jgi:hypothetical protein
MLVSPYLRGGRRELYIDFNFSLVAVLRVLDKKLWAFRPPEERSSPQVNIRQKASTYTRVARWYIFIPKSSICV